MKRRHLREVANRKRRKEKSKSLPLYLFDTSNWDLTGIPRFSDVPLYLQGVQK